MAHGAQLLRPLLTLAQRPSGDTLCGPSAVTAATRSKRKHSPAAIVQRKAIHHRAVGTRSEYAPSNTVGAAEVWEVRAHCMPLAIFTSRPSRVPTLPIQTLTLARSPLRRRQGRAFEAGAFEAGAGEKLESLDTGGVRGKRGIKRARFR
ncbi:MAG: hypothetical protein AAF384_02430 [Pseudomonadota bacterium]